VSGHGRRCDEKHRTSIAIPTAASTRPCPTSATVSARGIGAAGARPPLRPAIRGCRGSSTAMPTGTTTYTTTHSHAAGSATGPVPASSMCRRCRWKNVAAAVIQVNARTVTNGTLTCRQSPHRTARTLSTKPAA
jgi:hypothetical protein